MTGMLTLKGDCAKFIVQSSDMSYAVVQGRYIFVCVTRCVGGVLLSMLYHGNFERSIVCNRQLIPRSWHWYSMQRGSYREDDG